MCDTMLRFSPGVSVLLSASAAASQEVGLNPLGGSHEHHAASHTSPRSLVPLRSGLAGNRRQPRRYGRFAALALTPPRNRRVTGRRKTRHRDRRQLHYLAAGFGRHDTRLSGLVIRGCVIAGCREPPFAGLASIGAQFRRSSPEASSIADAPLATSFVDSSCGYLDHRIERWPR